MQGVWLRKNTAIHRRLWENSEKEESEEVC